MSYFVLPLLLLSRLNTNFCDFRSKVCVQLRILKPPGSLLATDRSKAVVLV